MEHVSYRIKLKKLDDGTCVLNINNIHARKIIDILQNIHNSKICFNNGELLFINTEDSKTTNNRRRKAKWII